jgi:hypothetical protein
MSSQPLIRKRPFSSPLLPAILLLILFASQLLSLPQTSPTYDEYEYITRGYTYLQSGNTNLHLRHPVLLDTLAAVPLLLLPTLQLPLEHPSLAAGDFHFYSRIFFWERNAALADQMIWLARLLPLALTLLLATTVYRWGTSQFGLLAGLVALTLAVFDPNLRAHGRLVTPDVGQTTFFFLACFLWWRYLQRPSRRRLLAAGVALGLAQAAGFPGLLLYPILAVVSAVTWWPDGRRYALISTVYRLFIAGLLSLVVVWAVYRFQWGHFAPLGINLPAPYHWQELYSLWQRLARQDLAYLNGEIYRGGRWQFFFTALFVKTPIPILLLAALGLAQFIWQRQLRATIALWLFPILYFAIALTSSLNIGYRHIFPILPFIYVWGGAAVALLPQPRQRKLVAALTLVWLIISTSLSYPYYLSYFNEIAGGPLGGRRFLVDSDLDWGQDLVGLQQYVQENDRETLYLSYFGTTPPEHYGIAYRPLPAWPPRGIPGQSFYHPEYPLPGIYALSVTNLVGARLEQNPATFAWFWSQEPVAQIGHSIDVYEVPRLLNPNAPPVDLLLAGTELAQLPASIIEKEMHTNDLRPRWIDMQQGLILPAGPVWLLRPADDAPAAAIAERFFKATNSQVVTDEAGAELLLEQLDGAALLDERLAQVGCSVTADDGTMLTAPVVWETAVSLLGYEWVNNSLEPGGILELLTYWEVQTPTQAPLTMFAHLLDANGQLVAQYDGIGVSPAYWHTGDWLVQRHAITLPAELPAEVRGIAVGLYRTDTLARLPLPDGSDRILIPLTEACADTISSSRSTEGVDE